MNDGRFLDERLDFLPMLGNLAGLPVTLTLLLGFFCNVFMLRHCTGGVLVRPLRIASLCRAEEVTDAFERQDTDALGFGGVLLSLHTRHTRLRDDERPRCESRAVVVDYLQYRRSWRV
ncbi:MAG: hypothetical protein M3451_09505 [Chloroflexota bacterium]|nr:hypothetical protein [Chloroflexota bacterium]